MSSGMPFIVSAFDGGNGEVLDSNLTGTTFEARLNMGKEVSAMKPSSVAAHRLPLRRPHQLITLTAPSLNVGTPTAVHRRH